MSLSGKAIVTEYQAKNYLKVIESSTEFDKFLLGDGYSGVIDLASEEIEGFVGGPVRAQVKTDIILDGSGACTLKLPHIPIVGISGENDDTRYTNLLYRFSASSAWTSLFTTEAELETYLYIDPVESWKLEILDGFKTFPSGRRNIKVTYIAGYEEIPADIQKVCLEMVAIMWAESQKDGRLGMQSKSYALGGANTSDSFKDMWPGWRRILDKYRKWNV